MPSTLLIYRIGSLGDTLVAVPSLWAVRGAFPDAHIALLSDVHPGTRRVMAADLLTGMGLVDEFITYTIPTTFAQRLVRPFHLTTLLLHLRRMRFDTLVYLAPSQRAPEQVARDRSFFRAAGIHIFYGMRGFELLPDKVPGQAMESTPFEADMLLSRLGTTGLLVPPATAGRIDLPVSDDNRRAVETWAAKQPPDGGRTWIGIGPGSKMPAKIWPRERYRTVVTELIDRFDVWPVIFGGPEDKDVGDWLIAQWGRGYNAAGKLGLRASIEGLRRCAIYLGNDTGTMHMAVAAGRKCVAIFSSRAHPGQWYPYGTGHRVFRTQIDCEGCQLVECVERKMECLMRIEPDDVIRAAAELLTEAGVKVLTRPVSATG
jgi:heptosyltransferase-3